MIARTTPVYTYAIRHPEYGVLLKLDASIADARRWAKRALGLPPSAVSRHMEPPAPKVPTGSILYRRRPR